MTSSSSEMGLWETISKRETWKDLFWLMLTGVLFGLIMIVAVQFFLVLSSLLMLRLGLVWNVIYYLPGITGGLLGGFWYFYEEKKRMNASGSNVGVEMGHFRPELMDHSSENHVGKVISQRGQDRPHATGVDVQKNPPPRRLVESGKVTDYYFFMLMLTFLVYLFELFSEGLPAFFLYFLLFSGWIALFTFHALNRLL